MARALDGSIARNHATAMHPTSTTIARTVACVSSSLEVGQALLLATTARTTEGCGCPTQRRTGLAAAHAVSAECRSVRLA